MRKKCFMAQPLTTFKWEFLVFSNSCSLLPKVLSLGKSPCPCRTAPVHPWVPALGSWVGGLLCWFMSADQVERSRSGAGQKSSGEMQLRDPSQHSPTLSALRPTGSSLAQLSSTSCQNELCDVWEWPLGKIPLPCVSNTASGVGKKHFFRVREVEQG